MFFYKSHAWYFFTAKENLIKTSGIKNLKNSNMKYWDKFSNRKEEVEEKIRGIKDMIEEIYFL